MEEERYGCHSQVEAERGPVLVPWDGSVPNTNWRAQLVPRTQNNGYPTQVCGQQGLRLGRMSLEAVSAPLED